MKTLSLNIFKNQELIKILIFSLIIIIFFYLIYKHNKHKDLCYLGIVVCIYLFISLTSLGSFKIPQTTWQPIKDMQSFIIELSQSEFEQINIIYGEGDNNALSEGYQLGVKGMHIEGSNDLKNWKLITTLKEGYIFEYQIIKGSYNYKYIKITSTNKLQTLTEIAFINNDKLIGNKIYKDNYSDSKYPATLVNDELDKVAIHPTYLDEFYFDEIYHIRNAKEVADGQYLYTSVHPLLGTNIIALFIKLFGFSPFVFRLPGVIFGALIIIAIYYLIKLLFSSSYLSFIASLLSLGDFMHLTTSRIGTLEPFVIFFIIVMYYFMIKYYKETNYQKEILNLFLSGIFMGLALSTKWNGAYATIGLAMILFRKLMKQKKQVIKTLLWCLLFFIIIPLLIYYLSFLPDHIYRHETLSISNLIKHNVDMFNYHYHLKASHPFESRWYQWLLDIRPVWYYYEDISHNCASTIACFNNPLLTWFSLPCLIYTLFNIKDTKAYITVMGFLSTLLPWIFINRATFAYHYYPSTIFIIISIIYCFNKLNNKNIINSFIFIYLLVFVIYIPICTGFITYKEYIKLLEILPLWYFG